MEYQVRFNTGSSYGDGTDELVLIRLYGVGEQKIGDFHCRSRRFDDFEAKKPRRFFEIRTDEYIGEIQKILVYVNAFKTTNIADNPAWLLNSVDIWHYLDGQKIEQNFKCGKWIGFPERCPNHTVKRFVECFAEGATSYDHDPEGEKQELNYPIRTAYGGVIYSWDADPYWEENQRVIINDQGKVVK